MTKAAALSSGFQVPRQYAYPFGSKSHAWRSKILSMSHEHRARHGQTLACPCCRLHVFLPADLRPSVGGIPSLLARNSPQTSLCEAKIEVLGEFVGQRERISERRVIRSE